MSAIACCLWWLLFGVLLGWLLNWLLSKFFRKDPPVVERVVEKIVNVEKPVDRIVEKIVEVEKPVERIVEKIVEVEKIVYRDAPSAAPLLGGLAAGAVAGAGLDFALAAKHGYRIKGDDDLTIVEGIGPAIARLLNESGVNTFTELSLKSVDELYAILKAGGERFRNHHPHTWPRQAEMAAQNRWEELRVWQDSLDGGLERSDS
jgi:predicted flap endonuclease-1-like 5' DNA nuclease